MNRLSSLLLLAVRIVGAASAALPQPILHCRFDGNLIAFGRGAAAATGDFRRQGTAYRRDFSACLDGQPRFEAGRFGQGLFMEAGHRGDLRRGQMNYLSPDQSSVEASADGLQALGGAQIRRVQIGSAARHGECVLGVAAAAGQSFETAGIPAKYWGDGLKSAAYIGSVYLRGARGGERVTVVLRDMTNGEEGKPMTLTLTTEWQRAHSLISIKKDRDSADLRLRVTNAGAGPIRFQADALMIEHSGRYNHFTTPSSWGPGWENRWTESLFFPIEDHFDARAGTVAFWVRPSATIGNSTFFCVGRGWKRAFGISSAKGRLVFVAAGATHRSGAKVKPGQWHHVAMSWDGQAVRGYLDGQGVLDAKAKPFEGDLDGYQLAIGFNTGDVTAANATLDEFMIFDRALSQARIEQLARAGEPTPAAGPVVVRKRDARRGFNRSEREADLAFVARNVSSTTQASVKAVVDIDGRLAQTVVLGEIAAGQDKPFAVRADMARLSVGAHKIHVRLSAAGRAEFPIVVGPWKPANRMPLVAWWSFNDLAGAKDFADHGVTGSYTFTRRGLDVCAQLGIDGGMRLFTNRFNRYGRPERSVIFKGKDRGVWWQSPAYQAYAVKEAAKVAMRYRHNPNFVHLNINTEAGQQINTSPQAMAFYRKSVGFDMPKFHLHESIHPPQLSVNWPSRIDEAYPKNGIVEPDNKWFRFFKWYWEQGHGVNVVDDAIAAEAKRVAPRLLALKEPALRWRPVFTHKHMDLLQEWVYVPDPKNMLPVIERLAAACRGQAIYSGMPQLLFKRGVAAPYAAAVPPGLYREALWMCLSRPVKLITIWGWHLVISDKLHNNPATYEEIKRFAAQVIKPYGPLLRKLENRPRKVAYLMSLAPDLFRKQRSYFEPSRTYKRLASDGVLADVLYDDSIAIDNALAKYDALILAHMYAIPRAVYDKIVEFQRRGGLVIADEQMGFPLPGVARIDGLDSGALVRLLESRGLVEARAGTSEVVINLRQKGSTNALVVVNDKREFGPLFGEYKKVRDRGIAQTATLRVSKSLGVAAYDLTQSKRVALRGDGEDWTLRVDLPACAGRIIAFYRQPIGKLSVELAAKGGEAGRDMVASIRLTDAGGRAFDGLVPVLVEIRRPDGALSDLSFPRVIEDGKLDVVIPVALDCPEGPWRMRITELASGQSVQSRL